MAKDGSNRDHAQSGAEPVNLLMRGSYHGQKRTDPKQNRRDD